MKMRNLTTEEMVSNGLKSLKAENYYEAEQWFLSAVYENTTKEKDYMNDSYARSLLADLYSTGHGPDKIRAKVFFEIFADADRAVFDSWWGALREGIVSQPKTGDFEYHKKTVADARVEFFASIEFRPTIDITTNADIHIEKPEKTCEKLLADDIAFQIRALNRIYDDATLAPVFHRNTKFCINELEKIIPYISYDDIMARKYIIRGRRTDEEFNSFDSVKRKVIVEYKSIEDLAKDGWRLD